MLERQPEGDGEGNDKNRGDRRPGDEVYHHRAQHQDERTDLRVELHHAQPLHALSAAKRGAHA